jgi:hypothetical protein
MRGPRALPPTVRCLASAVSGSKPPFLARQFLIDFHSIAVANKKFRMSSFAARLSARAWERRWGWPMRGGASRQGMILSRGHGTVVVERPWRFRSITRQ